MSNPQLTAHNPALAIGQKWRARNGETVEIVKQAISNLGIFHSNNHWAYLDTEDGVYSNIKKVFTGEEHPFDLMTCIYNPPQNLAGE